MLVADTPLSGCREAREPNDVIRPCRQPTVEPFPMCYGTDLTSMAILRWRQEAGVEWHYIALGNIGPTSSPSDTRWKKQAARGQT